VSSFLDDMIVITETLNTHMKALNENLKTATKRSYMVGIAPAPPAAAATLADSTIPVEDKAQSLNHLTQDGDVHMVSIASKTSTSRSATATALLLFSQNKTYNILTAARLQKGDAMAVARIAGIQGAKKTADLIPLAHPSLNITGVRVNLTPFASGKLPTPERFMVGGEVQPYTADGKFHGGVVIRATVECEGKTGVEMEAITAASLAGLTMYDMLKGVDKEMVLTATRVTAKSGGKSGDWQWDYWGRERKMLRTDPASQEIWDSPEIDSRRVKLRKTAPESEPPQKDVAVDTVEALSDQAVADEASLKKQASDQSSQPEPGPDSLHPRTLRSSLPKLPQAEQPRSREEEQNLFDARIAQHQIVLRNQIREKLETGARRAPVSASDVQKTQLRRHLLERLCR
jgi:molybdenum cofactor biosynthesis enzyme